VAFFPPRWSWRRRPPVPCSDCLALSAVPTAPGCPHTSGGALALALASAEPHAPLRPRHLAVPSSRPTPQGGGTGAVRQGAAGAGEGPHTAAVGAHRRLERRRSGGPITRRGLRGHGRGAPGRSLRPRHTPGRARGAGSPRARPVRPQAHPRRARRLEQRVPIAGRVAFSPVSDGPPPLLGQERHGGALAVGGRPSRQGRVASGRGPQHEPGRCRAGPRARRLASLAPCGPVACARRLCGTRDEAARGDALLHAGAALASGARLPQAQAQDVPACSRSPGAGDRRTGGGRGGRYRRTRGVGG
jgi:hypothetical protein